MDRAIVERAVRALAAVNSARDSNIHFLVVPGHEQAEVNPPDAHPPAKQAACESPHCAGCYEVANGVSIHPPKCGEDYRSWLERWEAQGRPQ